MRLAALYAGLLLFCPVLLFAQPRWRVVNWHADILGSIGGAGDLTLQQLSRQTRSPAFPYGGNVGLRRQVDILPIAASAGIGLTAGLYPYSKKRGCYNGRKEWQVGVFFRYIGVPGGVYGLEKGGAARDTLVYVDASFTQTRPVLGIMSSFTFRTNPASRVNVFAGASVDMGVGLFGKIRETYTREVYVPTDSGYHTLPQEEMVTRYPAHPLFLASLRLYYGLGIRLWSRSYLSFTSGIEVGAICYFPSPVTPMAQIANTVNLSFPL